jgi:hypothetical protein
VNLAEGITGQAAFEAIFKNYFGAEIERKPKAGWEFQMDLTGSQSS